MMNPENIWMIYSEVARGIVKVHWRNYYDRDMKAGTNG